MAQNAARALLMLHELNSRRAERHKNLQSAAVTPSSFDDEDESLASPVLWEFYLIGGITLLKR